MSLLLVTLLLMVILLFTPFGPKTIASIVDSTVDDLSIKGVSGSVLTGLKVDEFFWDSDVGILIRDINLSVDKYDTENKKIYAEKLAIGELAIILEQSNESIQAPNLEEKIELPDFGLPINIDAEELALDSLKIIKKIPDSDETQTLLFQIKGIALKDTSIKDGRLSFGSLTGQPTILEQPLKIDVANGSLNMNQPHELSTSGDISFVHPDLGKLKGQIQVGGTLTEYIVGAELNLEQEKIGSGSLSLNGVGIQKFDLNLM